MDTAERLLREARETLHRLHDVSQRDFIRRIDVYFLYRKTKDNAELGAGDADYYSRAAIESKESAAGLLAEFDALAETDGERAWREEREGKTNAPPAPPAQNEHVATDECGFDRNGSYTADHYVCMCGWEDTAPTVQSEALVFEKEGK